MISFSDLDPENSWSALQEVFNGGEYIFTSTPVSSEEVKGLRFDTDSYQNDDAGRTNGDYYAVCKDI